MTTKTTIMMVPCSYGEIMDKLTILEIKLSKCIDDSKKNNTKRIQRFEASQKRNRAFAKFIS